MKDSHSQNFSHVGVLWITTALFFIFLAGNAFGQVVFYTDEASWLSNVSGVETLTTDATSLATANELSSAPTQNEMLPGLLTFASVNTGLSRGFTVETLESGAGFTFSDGEPSPPFAGFEDALSVGDLDNFEDDDWQLTLTAGPDAYAFAFVLRDNGNTVDSESFTVYDDDQGGVLGSTTTIPEATGAGTFLGFVSNQPFHRVEFDEGASGDDIAIADFQFAIPEPSSFVLILLSGGTLLLRRRIR